jgi:hypothetical protein
MRIARLPLLVVLGLWSLAACASAGQSSIVGAEVKLWRPEADIELKSSTDALNGTDINAEDDLGLDAPDVVPYVKVWFGGKHRVAFSAMRLKLEGKIDLDESIVYDGDTYTVGDTVKTKLTANVYRLAWEADWISNGRMRIGTILGADLLDVTASLESQTTSLKEDGDARVPVPVVGLLAEVQLAWGISVYGEAAGFYAKYGDVEGRLVEAEAGLKYDLRGYVQISAGWRLMNINVEDQDNKFDLTLSGLVAGLGVRF